MSHEFYMQRCVELAKKGGLATRTNPMVGAVLVHNDRIIGEGWHTHYGGPHAEVNAIGSVKESDRKYISDSTLYVSLEPCCVEGKTPACTHLILKEGIPKVVVGSVDPDSRMQGKGILQLREKSVDLTQGILQGECEDLIKKFKVNLKGLPYICLKWATSFDQVMGVQGKQIAITGEKARWYTHKWRSQFDGILVGKKTLLTDHPLLDNRLFPGPSPVRIIMDSKLEIPEDLLKVVETKAIVVNCLMEKKQDHIDYIKVSSTNDWNEVLHVLFQRGIYSILVEGGAEILQSLIHSGLWHEARVLRTPQKLKSSHPETSWIEAPEIKGRLKSQLIIDNQTTAFVIDNEAKI